MKCPAQLHASPLIRFRRRSSLGFTLIELLAVIAVVAILAAILIPTFGSVRTKAQQTQCAFNLRRIGEAILLYASENNGELPGRDAGLYGQISAQTIMRTKIN
ncbi:type II secretion system protein [Coraliomargarita algicola]|uniref:Type II secretion system protein n=1 Tax=Coraliomargarita algicola TaxID=3092156 RepID=A0ABZ0RHW9_9BACT|nr:type II secretion system protein [Coraliomargarita sp. J2-16]WPJ95112.1 type II secretion system protein [Coraliomargarita sp. J2-16]